MNAAVHCVRAGVAALIAVLAVVAVVLVPSIAAAQDAGIGIRLTEAPENRRADPRASRYIVDHVKAGTTFTRGIEVSNGTDRDATVQLYAAAATLQNGEFIPAGGRTPNELSGWMRIEPATLTIPKGGGTGRATLTVAVPADATPGERYAVALAELPPPPGQGLVGLASRVGVRVYLSVGPGDEPPTDFELETFTPVNEAGKPGVTIHSCNTGGRALDLGGSITLTDGPAGISAGPFTSTQPASFSPGQCADLKILLDPQLPRGPWEATATLRSGTKEKSSHARITFPEPGATAPSVKAESVGTSDRPLLAAGAVVLVLLSGGAAFTLWRRRAAAVA